MEAKEVSDTQGAGRPISFGRQTLFDLSFPLFLHSLIAFAVMLADTMIISAHSLDAAAAVAVAKQILQIAFEISTMAGIGAVILISHSLGRGDEAQARQVAGDAIVTNGLFGLLIGLLLAGFGPIVLWLLNTPEALAGEASRYIYVVAAAMAFNGVATAAVPCLRAFGWSRTILVLGMLLSGVYLALDYVLVLGWGPLPALGVLGAALSVLWARITTAVVLAAVLARKLGQFNALRTTARFKSIARRLFGLSFPSVSDYIAYGFYQLILLGFVAGFGVVAVLSRTYVMIAMAFLILVVMAVGQGNEVLLGYRQGKGESDQAYWQGIRSCCAATVATVLLATLLWLSSTHFIGLFTEDEAVLVLSKRLLLLTILIQPGLAFNTILFQSLRAVGDVRWPVLVSQATTWGLGLPLAWLLCIQCGLSVEGVWYALIVEETVKAGLMLARWNARGWRHHVLA